MLYVAVSSAFIYRHQISLESLTSKEVCENLLVCFLKEVSASIQGEKEQKKSWGFFVVRHLQGRAVKIECIIVLL